MPETADKPFRPFRARAVLFDFDGTLTRPGVLDWDDLRARIGCPPGNPVLEFIEALPEPRQQSDATAILEAFEDAGAAGSRPADGVYPLIAGLRKAGIPIGILTRNRRRSVDRALENFSPLGPSDFDLILTREASIAPKPDPQGVLHFSESVGVPVEDVVVVGDFFLDMEAGRRAGAVTILIDHGTARADDATVDYCISSLDQVDAVLQLGRPINGGKLPNDLLEKFLDEFSIQDPALLIQPGIGQDTAAVDIDSDPVLVLKSDPITFVTDAIGRYAVLVNANDIATAGAIPRWFLSTLLFPPGVTPSEIRQVMKELQAVCQAEGITLCGGHTEVTDAVTRPVVIGMLAGTVEKDRLVDKKNMSSGNAVLLTKAVAVEGTAIIAREFSEKLSKLGLSAQEIDTAAGFLSGISILDEARIAADNPGVTALHDVTEGGLATALEELSAVGRHRIQVDRDRIPIFPETEKICRLLSIDPLGLIGSGSLLICCREEEAAALMDSVAAAGIAVTRIGTVQDPGRGIDALENGQPAEWPSFDADELTRLF